MSTEAHFGLRQVERQLSRNALAYIETQQDLLLHLDLCTGLMAKISQLVDALDDSDADLSVIRSLTIRAGNHFTTGVALMLRGQVQAGVVMLRDVVETAFLVDFFGYEPHRIAEWRDQRDIRLKKYRPSDVRKLLDEKLGLKSSRRHTIYDAFCKFAAHPDPMGFPLQKPKSEATAKLGPFLDADLLRAGLEEAALVAVVAGLAFSDWARPRVPTLIWLGFYSLAMNWRERFEGATDPNKGDVHAMLDLLLAEHYGQADQGTQTSNDP